MYFKDDTVYVYNGIIMHHDNNDRCYFAKVKDKPQYEYGVVIEAPTQMALFHQISNLGF